MKGIVDNRADKERFRTARGKRRQMLDDALCVQVLEVLRTARFHAKRAFSHVRQMTPAGFF